MSRDTLKIINIFFAFRYVWVTNLLSNEEDFTLCFSQFVHIAQVTFLYEPFSPYIFLINEKEKVYLFDVLNIAQKNKLNCVGAGKWDYVAELEYIFSKNIYMKVDKNKSMSTFSVLVKGSLYSSGENLNETVNRGVQFLQTYE